MTHNAKLQRKVKQLSQQVKKVTNPHRLKEELKKTHRTPLPHKQVLALAIQRIPKQVMTQVSKSM